MAMALLVALSPSTASADCEVSLGVRTQGIGTQQIRVATASAEPFTSEPDSVEAAEAEADLAARALLIRLDEAGTGAGSLSGVTRLASCFDGRFVHVTVVEDPELARMARELRERMVGGG